MNQDNHDECTGRTVTFDYAVYRDFILEKNIERQNLTRALILVIVLLFVSNMAWLWAWMQYDYFSTETTVESDGSSIANYTGGDGGVTIGSTNNGTENGASEAISGEGETDP